MYVVNRILGIFLVKAIVVIFLVQSIFLVICKFAVDMSYFEHVIFFRVAYVLPEMSIHLRFGKFQALD